MNTLFTAFSALQILKKEADEFEFGQWIPQCELAVEWEQKDAQPVRLRHKVVLNGAKPPRNYLFIILDPQWEGMARSFCLTVWVQFYAVLMNSPHPSHFYNTL